MRLGSLSAAGLPGILAVLLDLSRRLGIRDRRKQKQNTLIYLNAHAEGIRYSDIMWSVDFRK